MVYTVGEMVKMLEVLAFTLRYYDKERLLPFVERSPGGMRMFQEKDFEWLQVIGCLKKAGMPLRDIRVYIELAMQGDDTIGERLALFEHQREVLREQMEQLQRTMERPRLQRFARDGARSVGAVQQLDAAQIPKARLPRVRGELRSAPGTDRSSAVNETKLHEFHLQTGRARCCPDCAVVLVAPGKRASPIVGGPVFAIVSGMIVTLFIRDRSTLQSGITFVSKKTKPKRDSARPRHESPKFTLADRGTANDHSGCPRPRS